MAKISSVDSELVERVAERNVELMVDQIKRQSPVLKDMAANGEIGIVGGMYNIENGQVTFYSDLD